MEWMACIDLPAFCLQLLLRRERSWRQLPAAVVESDKPLALLLHVNEHARRKGILPGMRYSAALSLSGALRAAPVSAEQTERGLEEVVRLLGRFTPEVEPSRDDPGVFWVNATGPAQAFYDGFGRRVKPLPKLRELCGNRMKLRINCRVVRVGEDPTDSLCLEMDGRLHLYKPEE